MRVLLINPSSFDGKLYQKEGRCEGKAGSHLIMPLSLATIASMLRDNGFEIDLYDFMALKTPVEAMNSIFSQNYNLVFINTSTPTFNSDKRTAKMIKKITPNSKVCGIGTFVTAMPEEALEGNGFDIVIMREPELTALELCLAIEGGYDLRGVKGIYFKEGEDIIKNPLRPFISDLDSLPYPARDLLPGGAYIEPKSGQPYTVIRTSRGCPFKCIFCTVGLYYGYKWRCRSVKNIVDEIEHVKTNFGIDNFLFMADTFTLSETWSKGLCDEIIARGIDVKWVCNSRIDTLDEETARKMAKAGCWLIGLGVESGSSKIIKNICKKIDPTQTIKTVQIARKAGIKTQTYYVFGFPGETPQTIAETIDLAVKVDSDFARFYGAIPFPGTELYELAKREGWYVSKEWDRFSLSSSDAMAIGGVKPEEIQKAIRRANIRFYCRPRWVIRFVRTSNYGELLRLLKLGMSYFREWV